MDAGVFQSTIGYMESPPSDSIFFSNLYRVTVKSYFQSFFLSRKNINMILHIKTPKIRKKLASVMDHIFFLFELVPLKIFLSENVFYPAHQLIPFFGFVLYSYMVVSRELPRTHPQCCPKTRKKRLHQHFTLIP